MTEKLPPKEPSFTEKLRPLVSGIFKLYPSFIEQEDDHEMPARVIHLNTTLGMIHFTSVREFLDGSNIIELWQTNHEGTKWFSVEEQDITTFSGALEGELPLEEVFSLDKLRKIGEAEEMGIVAIALNILSSERKINKKEFDELKSALKRGVPILPEDLEGKTKLGRFITAEKLLTLGDLEKDNS